MPNAIDFGFLVHHMFKLSQKPRGSHSESTVQEIETPDLAKLEVRQLLTFTPSVTSLMTKEVLQNLT